MDDSRPRLPLNELVGASQGADPDYCDGDHSGYHSMTLANGVLTLNYEADEYSENASTTAQFVEVGAMVEAFRNLVVWPDEDAQILEDLSRALGTELCPYVSGVGGDSDTT